MVIFNFFKFLYNDVKTDIKFIINLVKNGGKFDERQTALAKELVNFSNMGEALKQNWIWLILLMVALAVGFFFAALYYQDACNQFIYDNYLFQSFEKISLNFTYNGS